MQATKNAMYTVKGEKHVFTNNGRYMQLLDKMKAHVRQEDKENFEEEEDEEEDEVSTATLQTLAKLVATTTH